MGSLSFETKKDKAGGWVLIRTGYPYEFHAHLKTRKSCYMLINLIKAGTLPRSHYLQGSCRRLLTEDEFIQLKKTKDRYTNKPRRPNHG